MNESLREQSEVPPLKYHCHLHYEHTPRFTCAYLTPYQSK